MLKVSTLPRVFFYDGQELPDPMPGFSPAQVMDLYAANFPDLTTAEIEGPNEVDGKLRYVFKRANGTKGLGAEHAQEAELPFVQRLALVAAGRADPLQARGTISLSEKEAVTHQAIAKPLIDSRSRPGKGSLPGLPSEDLPLLL